MRLVVVDANSRHALCRVVGAHPQEQPKAPVVGGALGQPVERGEDVGVLGVLEVAARIAVDAHTHLVLVVELQEVGMLGQPQQARRNDEAVILASPAQKFRPKDRRD
jgi:hypothetical protein